MWAYLSPSVRANQQRKKTNHGKSQDFSKTLDLPDRSDGEGRWERELCSLRNPNLG